LWNIIRIYRVNNNDGDVSVARHAADIGGGEGQGDSRGRQGADRVGAIGGRRYRAWRAGMVSSMGLLLIMGICYNTTILYNLKERTLIFVSRKHINS